MRPFFHRPVLRPDLHARAIAIVAKVNQQIDEEFSKLPKPRPWREKPDPEVDAEDVNFRRDPGPVKTGTEWKHNLSLTPRPKSKYPYAPKAQKRRAHR